MHIPRNPQLITPLLLLLLKRSCASSCAPRPTTRTQARFFAHQPLPLPAAAAAAAAASAASQEILRILVSAKANVQALDIFGTNALVGSVKYGHKGSTAILLAAGARCVGDSKCVGGAG